MPEFLKKAARQLPAVLGLILLVGAIYVVWKEFRHLKISDIAAALGDIPVRSLALGFLWTVLSYGVLTFYDRLGTIYAGHKVSYGKVAFASFCAYSLSHNLGFAAVSGAAVRYRLYAHWGLTAFQIAKVVAFCSLTFGLGGMVLGGIILFWEPDAVPFFGHIVPKWGMYAVGGLLWGIVAGYIGLSRFVGTIRLFGADISLPGWRMAFVQVALATVDVAVTAAIMYELLPDVPNLTFIRFLGVYVSSYTAGLAANIPGGLGVFDSAMLLGLEPYMDAPRILGAVVVFRLYYYIIPLFLAGSMFAGNEILLRGGALMRSNRLQGLALWSEPAFAVVASTGAVALCGAMLLGLGVLDQRPDFSWIDPDFAEVAVSAGEFIPSLIGAALIVLAIGLSRRVTLAWGATLVLLLLAAAWTLAQGTVWWVPAVLILAMLLVAPFRDAYYRHARLLTGPLRPGTALSLLALAGCILVLARFEPHLRGLAENGLLDILLSPAVPNSTRVTIALLVILGLIALWRLIRPGKVGWIPWAGEGRLRYAALGGFPPANADGLVMGETGRAAIPFRRVGRVMLALGDPAGALSDRTSAIWNLR
ncbi:MAG TPA: lysylphosphatidylglycerol synthetase family protein, partial [Acetobacteraceae bacterium]|nr:lysylphosphatidylglycerol synthetase family protein [Acetobacteraceae bacterium]